MRGATPTALRHGEANAENASSRAPVHRTQQPPEAQRGAMDECYVFACLATLVDDPYRCLSDDAEVSDDMAATILRGDRALTTIAATHRVAQWSDLLRTQLATRPFMQVQPARGRKAACAACGKTTECGFTVTLSGPKLDGPACLARDGEPDGAWMDRLPWAQCAAAGARAREPPARKFRVGPVCRTSMLRTHAAHFFKLHVVTELSRLVLDTHEAGKPPRVPDSRVLSPLDARKVRELTQSRELNVLAMACSLTYAKLSDVESPLDEPLLPTAPDGPVLVAFTPPILVNDSTSSNSPPSSPSSSSFSSSSCSPSGSASDAGSSDVAGRTARRAARFVLDDTSDSDSDSSTNSPPPAPPSHKRAPGPEESSVAPSARRARHDSAELEKLSGRVDAMASRLSCIVGTLGGLEALVSEVHGAVTAARHGGSDGDNSGDDSDRTVTDDEMMRYMQRDAARCSPCPRSQTALNPTTEHTPSLVVTPLDSSISSSDSSSE